MNNNLFWFSNPTVEQKVITKLINFQRTYYSMSIDGKKLWAKLIVDKCIFSLDYRTPTEEYEEKVVSKCSNLLKLKWTNLLYAE